MYRHKETVKFFLPLFATMLACPLPAATQFLNVIESVFEGLAKVVIHNSENISVDTRKEAINPYFRQGNQDFKANRRRAGRKIWDKEVVKAKFRETQNCRVRSAVRGVKNRLYDPESLRTADFNKNPAAPASHHL